MTMMAVNLWLDLKVFWNLVVGIVSEETMIVGSNLIKVISSLIQSFILSVFRSWVVLSY